MLTAIRVTMTYSLLHMMLDKDVVIANRDVAICFSCKFVSIFSYIGDLTISVYLLHFGLLRFESTRVINIEAPI